jgi:hypothetical protein
MCICVFLVMGIESTIQDWISTYAVKSSVSSSMPQAAIFFYIFLGL